MTLLKKLKHKNGDDTTVSEYSENSPSKKWKKRSKIIWWKQSKNSIANKLHRIIKLKIQKPWGTCGTVELLIQNRKAGDLIRYEYDNTGHAG